jgi:hypothetical protein
LEVVVVLPHKDGKDSSDAEKAPNSDPLPLLAALLVKDEIDQKEKFYLFDPALGLPIPGPGGNGIATLEQAQNDDAIFRALDIEGEYNKYGWTAKAIQNVDAGLVASPLMLSQKAALLESQLEGEYEAVLTLDVSRISKKVQSTGKFQKVVLWEEPFVSIMNKRQLVAAKDPTPPREKMKRE